MLKALSTAVLLASGFALAADQTFAQANPCTNRAAVIQQLSSEYSEDPVAMGLANNGGVIELLHSRDRATWTLIITMPDGTTCPIAAGENWERLPLKARGERI